MCSKHPWIKLIEFSKNFPYSLLGKLIKNKNSFSSRRMWYIKKDVLQCTYYNPKNEILVEILFSRMSDSYMFCSARKKSPEPPPPTPTPRTVTFVIRNTKKLCWIISHRKWATTYHCRHKNNCFLKAHVSDLDALSSILKSI